MKERERVVASGLIVLMLVVWLGFLVHRSPRFAGSGWGGLLAVTGSVLMLIPLAYLVVKRIPALKRRITRFASMRTLLAWHIYAGIVGPVLVLLHTGHRFESPLGIALTAMTIVVVLSGFVGRYLMNQFSREIREKTSMLAELNAAYDRLLVEFRRHPERAEMLRSFSGVLSRLAGTLLVNEPEYGRAAEGAATASPSVTTALRLAESIADVEYAIETHEAFKRWFGAWLRVHIVISVVLYALLALHVWAAVHFGLRWFG